jgi:hypothetical protein
MYAGAAAVYGGKQQTRCLAAVLGDQERHRFLTGSTSLREPNEVGLLVVEIEAACQYCCCWKGSS